MPLPRIAFEDFPASISERLAPRVKRLGYLGEFFKCAAHQPDALAAFIDFTESSKGTLPPNMVEIIALTVCGRTGNAYEKNQHERLSVRLGLGRDWVAAVNAMAPDTPSALSEDERRLQELVLRVVESNGHRASELFEEHAARYGPEQAMAILMVIGRYVVHGLIVNTLALEPPVPSIFDDGFGE